MKSDTDLIKLIERRIAKSRQPQPLKSTIDSTYTTGLPKTKRPEDGSATGKTKQVLLGSYFSPVVASSTVVEIPVGDDTFIAGVIGTPPSLANVYQLLPEFPTGGAATTVGVASANQVRCYRFVARSPIPMAKLIFEIVNSVGGSNVGIAIYAGDGTTRLYTTGSLLSAGGVTNVTVSPALQLQGGVPYYIAWSSDDNTVTWRAVTLDANLNTMLNTGTVQLGTAANAATSGAPPSSLGTVSSGSFNIPIFKLQA